MNKNIDISIIVPCYNQGIYLDECLESVLSQTYNNWECIIVNDGSTDHTEKIALNWTYRDTRFRYINKENDGLSSARNSGIKKAKGKYILPLDADDKISKDYCEKSLQIFKDNSNVTLVYCNARKFGTLSENWNLPDYSFSRLLTSNMIFCSGIYKKKDWGDIGGYDLNMKYGWEDWDFWISLLKNQGIVHKIEEVHFFYRVKSQSMISNLDIKQKIIMKEYLSKKHIDHYIAYHGNIIDLCSLKENFLGNKDEFINRSLLNNRLFLIKQLVKTIFSNKKNIKNNLRT